MRINVRFEEETYVAEMSADDFNYTKNYYPHRTISVKGFGGMELNVPIKYLTLESEDSNGSSAYCQKGFFKNVPIKYLTLESEDSNGSSAYCQKGFFKKDTR